jgi:hypothetical protein
MSAERVENSLQPFLEVIRKMMNERYLTKGGFKLPLPELLNLESLTDTVTLTPKNGFYLIEASPKDIVPQIKDKVRMI